MNEKDRPESIEADLAALKRVSAREVPSLEQTMQSIRSREAEEARTPLRTRIWREIMSGFTMLKNRPGLAALAVAAVVVIAMLVVPVSYSRVTGHDVSLTLAAGAGGAGGMGGAGGAAAPTSAEIATIAKSLKARLGVPHVAVEAMEDGAGGTKYVFHAATSERSRAKVALAAEGFARELAAKSIPASVSVSPRVEQVRYPVAAYAWDQIIQISIDGKSASELQAEIQQRLTAAGISDAQVSVTDAPNGGHEVSVKVQKVADGSTPISSVTEPEIVLTKGGVPLTGGLQVRVKKERRTGSATETVIDVTSDGKTATVDIPNSDAMTDTQLAAAIQSQLEAKGINATVTVTNGEIKIAPVK